MRRLKVYLIARISEDAHERNNKICSYLDERIDVFKPQNIVPTGLGHEEFQKSVFQTCVSAMIKSDMGLLVVPYGNDCSWEIGYYSGSGKPVIAYIDEETRWLKDWMIKGGLDFVITSNKFIFEKLKKDPILYSKCVLIASPTNLSDKLFELCWKANNE